MREHSKTSAQPSVLGRAAALKEKFPLCCLSQSHYRYSAQPDPAPCGCSHQSPAQGMPGRAAPPSWPRPLLPQPTLQCSLAGIHKVVLFLSSSQSAQGQQSSHAASCSRDLLGTWMWLHHSARETSGEVLSLHFPR